MTDSIRLEQRRLAYVVQRDGEPTAKQFAERTYRQYRQALKTGYGRAYRRELIESCIVFRKFLNTCIS
jgi:hypothetical protein